MKKKFFLLALLFSTNIYSAEFEVFFDSSITKYNITDKDLADGKHTVTLFDFDLVEKFDENLSVNLPKNEADARLVANKYINENNTYLINKSLIAYKPIIKALGYGITKHPAIVVNGSVVLYGTTDLNFAYTEYIKWLK